MGIEPLSRWGFRQFPIIEIGLATNYIHDLIFSSYMYRDAFNDRHALNDEGLA